MASDVEHLGRFRPYLQFLAQMSWDPFLQPKMDPSDVVQQTLLQAHAGLDQYQGQTDAELAGWLRRILANVLAERQRHFHRDKRDVSRERPFEQALLDSSRRLVRFAAPGPSPSQQAEFSERALQVASAVDSLPEGQRQALLLHYWSGHSIPEIARFLERTPSAVAGLIHRGLKALREKLSNLQDG